MQSERARSELLAAPQGRSDRRKMATKLLNAVIKDVFTLPDAPLCDIIDDPKKPTHEGIQNFVRCLDPRIKHGLTHLSPLPSP